MSDENFFEVGARISALRGAMKQSEFAERLGVHRNSVVGWEAGKRLPDGESLVRMSEQFNADIHVLLMGKEGGAAPELRPDEEKLLADYRAAHSDARERIRQIAATAANSPKRGVKAGANEQTPNIQVGNMTNSAAGSAQVGYAGGNVTAKTVTKVKKPKE